jgi:CHAT domain-containing protein/Flp pilus assembly protein TadD
MRSHPIFPFAAWLLLSVVPLNAQDSDVDQRAKRDRLWAAAKKAKASGQLDEAAELGEQVLTLEKTWLGQRPTALLETLNWLAEVYQKQPSWEKTIERRKSAARLTREIHGETDWRTIDARIAVKNTELRSRLTEDQHHQLSRSDQLNKQRISMLQAGNYPVAIDAAKSLLAIRKKVLGAEHPNYAETLNDLALLYDLMGDYARAESLYLQSKEIWKKVVGEKHPSYATTLNNLAVLFKSKGDFQQAELLYLQCKEIWKEATGEEHRDYATSLNNLALLYVSVGDLDRAEPLFVQCKEILKKVVGEKHRSYAATLNNLAGLYDSLGDYKRAEPLYLQSGEIWKKLVGEDHPDYATLLNNLASLYESMGNYTRAEHFYLQSEGILKKVVGEKHPSYATALNNLALLYKSMGDYVRAEALFLRSKEIRKKVLGKEHAVYAMSLHNLALLYVSMGDYARAETLSLECKEIWKKVVGEEHPGYVPILNNLALLYESRGDYAQAEQFYLQCKEISKKVFGEEHLDYAMTLNNLAGLYESAGEYARAEPLAANALEITLKHLQRTSLVLSERQQLAMNQSLRFRLDHYVSLAIEEGDTYRSKAARQILTWKGATLVRQREMRKAAGDPGIADQFKQLLSLASRLATISRADLDAKPKNWRQQVQELTSAKEKLESELSRKSAKFREALNVVTPELIQTSIPKDAVLVDFLEYTHSKSSAMKKGKSEFTPSLLAVVARRNGEPTLMALGPKASLSQAIDKWRKTFGMSPQSKQAGAAIRKQIWEPLLKHIGEAKTVLVSTDGVLGQLPIGALPGKQAGTFLIEDHRLALIPVPQLLPAMVNDLGKRKLKKALLTLGDVDYDASIFAEPKPTSETDTADVPFWQRGNNGEYFASLENTGGEIAQIKRLFQKRAFGENLTEQQQLQLMDLTKELTGKSATESRFCELAPKYANLHLATHGFFAGEEHQSALSTELIRSAGERTGPDSRHPYTAVSGINPGLLSGLVFAGANQTPTAGQDDGILTAQEIAFLPLDGVQTAVLSACETGLGKVAGGEGLIGIQRAFQISGVETTVASLWKVDDVVTRLLMERFYQNMWEKKMSKLDALRDAQLYLLNNPQVIRSSLSVDAEVESKRLSPKLWAAFQLSGDWR